MGQNRGYFQRLALACLTLLALFIAWTSLSFAQGGVGTINGTVTDPKGLSVPGATVLIHNTDTNIDRTVTTTDAGLYTATFLPSGHYEVTASKEGFAKQIRKDLPLQVGQTMTIDFAMVIQAAESVVTVTGEAPVLETTRTEMSQTVSQTLAAGLPLNGRRWDSFVLLTPGVTNDGGSGLISYRGISGIYNGNSVDGANNNQAFFSEARGRTSVGYTYSLDAIKEFQVSSSNYSAEFGQAGGGTVNAVTKSGSNDLHGDLFYYLRYPTTNALDPFAKTHGIAATNGTCPANFLFISEFNSCVAQAEHQRQQFGGSIGGPIKRDKVFYFVNYDGQRRSFPIVYTGPVGATNLAAVSPANCPAQVDLTTQCIPALAFITGSIGPQPRHGNQDIYLGKLDYQATPNNHLSASFNFMNWKAQNDYTTSATQGSLVPSSNGYFVTHDRYLVLSWSSVISSTMVNDFRFQWGRDLQVYGANASGPSVTLGPSTTSGIVSYGMPNALPRPAFPDEHRLQFADSVSVVRNKHVFKFGVDISPIHELLINLFQGGGIYTYNGSTAKANIQNWVADLYGANLGDGNTGKHYTTFTQVFDGVNPTAPGKDDFYNVDYAAYVTDTWKIRPSLTLNLGVRYDLQWVPQPSLPNNRTPLLAAYSTHINIDKNNLGPRIGIAWQPWQNLVVRAGYGMFYAKTTNSTNYTIRVENGVIQQTFLCNPGTTCAPTFPNLVFAAPGPALAAPFSAPGILTPIVQPGLAAAAQASVGTQLGRGLTPDFVNPLVHEGEFGIEGQLPGHISLSGTFLFSRALRLPVFVDANLAPTASTRTYNVLDSTGATVSTVTVPLYTSRVDPTGVILTGSSVLNSWYNGLVVTARKPFSRGFELMANYTISKAIDGGQVPGQFGTFNGTDFILDPKNLKPETALSDLDQRQRFVGSFLYAPTFKVENSIIRGLVNHFNFSGIVSIASPQPVTAKMTGFPSCNSGLDGGATCGLVNNTGSRNSGRAPQIGRNTFHGPTQIRSVDFRVARDIPLWHEKTKLQLIAEAFNLFNHTIVTDVNTTAFSFSSTNTNITPVAGFLAPIATSNGLVSARQMQFSAKLNF